jgi:hypothetical protein
MTKMNLSFNVSGRIVRNHKKPLFQLLAKFEVKINAFEIQQNRLYGNEA